jgi:hypothetical protein
MRRIALAASPKPGWCWRPPRATRPIFIRSFRIGDRWRDIDCGASAGVRTVLIDRGYRERAPERPDSLRNRWTPPRIDSATVTANRRNSGFFA